MASDENHNKLDDLCASDLFRTETEPPRCFRHGMGNGREQIMKKREIFNRRIKICWYFDCISKEE